MLMDAYGRKGGVQNPPNYAYLIYRCLQRYHQFRSFVNILYFEQICPNSHSSQSNGNKKSFADVYIDVKVYQIFCLTTKILHCHHTSVYYIAPIRIETRTPKGDVLGYEFSCKPSIRFEFDSHTTFVALFQRKYLIMILPLSLKRKLKFFTANGTMVCD